MVSGPLVSGIASLIVGIIAIIIGVVISQAIKTAIHDGVNNGVTIKSKTGANYDSWRSNTGGASAEAFRSFYMYNITNMPDVVKNNAVPVYEEVGPFVYQNLYEKIDVNLNKTTHSADYRTYSRYIFREDKSVMSDTADIFQVNPGYILAAYKNIDPEHPANPVSASEAGVLASVVSGAFSQIHSQIKPTSTFPNLIRTNYFQPTFKAYRDLLVNYKYGGDKAAFVNDLAAGTITLPWSNCTLVSAAAQSSCAMYNGIRTFNIIFNNLGATAVANLMDDSNPGSFLHANNLWIKALQNKGADSYNTLYTTPAAASISASASDVNIILGWMASFFDRQELVILRYWLGWGSTFTFEDAGYFQFATLTPLNGLSLRHQNPTLAFYPDYAGYVKYGLKMSPNPYPITTSIAKSLFSQKTLGTVTYNGLADARIIGMILKYKSDLAKMQFVGFTSTLQASLFAGHILSIYQATITPLCNQMNAYGTCFYRRTSVQNLLFGTTNDAMITFFTQGAKTSAGIFANHTSYEVARAYDLNGDEVDTGYHKVKDIGKIYKVNGANKIVRSDGVTDSWNGTVPITGRNVQFPPFSSDGYTQAIYSSSLYRNLNLKKIGDTTVKGIDMRHFQIDPANYDPTDSTIRDTYYIKYNGVMDYGRTELVSGAPNIPILATNPHLFNTDRTIFKDITCTVASIDSLGEGCFTPDGDNSAILRDKYTTNFYIEPLTGIPMKGNAVVQFWIYVDSNAKKNVFNLNAALTGTSYQSLSFANNHIPDAPIPVCYLRDSSELTDKNADDFKNTIYAGQKMGQTMGVALPVIGAFLLVFSFALLFWHVKLVKEGDSVNKP